MPKPDEMDIVIRRRLRNHPGDLSAFDGADVDEEDHRERRPRIEPDERDEYDEWRQERRARGRKPRPDDTGRRQRQDRLDDH